MPTIGGQGTVTAARMAVDDFGGKVLGRPIEIVFADHQNKADLAGSLARQWFDDQGVEAILDVAALGDRTRRERDRQGSGRRSSIVNALPCGV